MNTNTQPVSTVGNAAAEPVIIRPLGKMERSLWFCDQSSPTNIGVGCELHGDVTDDALRTALRWCQGRHPLLRSVIRRKDGNVFFACHDAATAPEIPLTIGEGTRADEDRVATEEMQAALNGTDHLLARVRLVRLGARRAFLFVVFSHVVGDGYSAVLFLQDVINALGALARDGALAAPTPLPFPLPSEEGIPSEHRGWSGVKKLFAVQKEVGAAIKQFGAKPSPIRVQGNPPPVGRAFKTLGFSLTEDETLGLVAQAKRDQVTVYALLSALLLDAVRPLLEPTTKGSAGPERVVSFASPVDMRPFLTTPAKGQFGFFSSALNHLYRIGETNDLPALAKQVHADLKKSYLQKKVHLHTSPLFASFLSWRWMFPANEKGIAKVVKTTEGMFRTCATSMTFLNDSLEIDETQGITISRPRGHISPSIMGAALYCVTLYKNVLTVHLNYNEGQLSDADAELLNGRFRANALAVGRATTAGAGAAGAAVM